MPPPSDHQAARPSPAERPPVDGPPIEEPASIETSVADLVAAEAVRDVVRRYCRGIDRLDLELVRSCYHADATDTHGTFSGTVDEYLTWVTGVLARYDATFHLLGQQSVEVVGDVARSEAYGVAHHRGDPTDPRRNLVVGFRFLDRMERRPTTGWRIARRVATTEWVQSVPPDHRWPLPPGGAEGRRGPGDPLFTLGPEFPGFGAHPFAAE